MPPIYLDSNSNCPLLAEVAAALAEAYAAGYANPASQHAEGRRARRALEDAREEIARLLGADLTGPQPDRLIFASGGTEANNLALRGMLSGHHALGMVGVSMDAAAKTDFRIPNSEFSASDSASPLPSAFRLLPSLIISAIEHPSIMATADVLGATGSASAFDATAASGATDSTRLSSPKSASVPGGMLSGHHATGMVGVSMIRVEKLRVTRDGLVDLAHLDELLSGATGSASAPGGMLSGHHAFGMVGVSMDVSHSAFRLPPSALISVLLANNETGVLQPLPEIVRRCSAARESGATVLVHTDAVQAVGKIPVSFRALGVDAMTVAPHKFGGPRGIGALLVRHGVDLAPILHGATQQFGLRPGTESVVLAIGFLAALRAWARDRDDRPRRLAALRDRFESGLRSLCAETPLPLRGEVGRGVQATSTYSPLTYSPIQINGAAAPRLPNTSNVAFLGHDRQALFMALDLAGVCCSTGSACQSGSSEPSPTLLAMGLAPEIVNSSLRFSLGPTTTEADIDEALRRIAAACC